MTIDGNDIDIGEFTSLNVPRIKGLAGGDVIYLGSNNCAFDVAGGFTRVKSNSGAYLIIGDSGLTYYDSGGNPHIVAFV